MKYTIYFIAMLSFWACSGDDSNAALNTAPIAPELVYPTNNLLCIDNSLNFQWKASANIDGDAVSYFIEVAKDNGFSQIVKSGTINQTNKTYELEKATAYYWRIYAQDTEGNKSSYSTIWNLFTEGNATTNHLPFLPTLITPTVHSIVYTSTVLLEWNGSDVDNDQLTYDVYFSESPTPIKTETNISKNSLQIAITPNKSYYWRIDTIDSKGGKTIGKTWEFSTE